MESRALVQLTGASPWPRGHTEGAQEAGSCLESGRCRACGQMGGWQHSIWVEPVLSFPGHGWARGMPGQTTQTQIGTRGQGESTPSVARVVTLSLPVQAGPVPAEFPVEAQKPDMGWASLLWKA